MFPTATYGRIPLVRCIRSVQLGSASAALCHRQLNNIQKPFQNEQQPTERGAWPTKAPSVDTSALGRQLAEAGLDQALIDQIIAGQMLLSASSSALGYLSFLAERKLERSKLDEMASNLKKEMEKNMNVTMENFGKLDAKMEKNMNVTTEIFGKLDAKMEKMGSTMDFKIEKLDSKIESKIEKMGGKFDKVYTELKDLNNVEWRLKFWIASVTLLGTLTAVTGKDGGLSKFFSSMGK